MRRDTLVFALAGIVFGFVVGYMSASWGESPRAAQTASAAPAPDPAGTTPAATIDPSEEQALVAFARREPGDVGVRVELGNLYMDHQRWDEAVRWYREALVLNPGLIDVLTDLGASLVHSGRPAEGLAEFEKALAQNEDHRNALYNKGIALVQLGRAEEAVVAWEDVLRRHPNDPQLSGLPAEIDRLQSAEGARP
jgi:cytochrome c-type biogenesis protein CcmH/NrfG